MKKVFAAVALAVFGLRGAAVFSAQEKTTMVGGPAMYPSKDILENALNSADHTTLVAAVKAAGLVDTLKGPGPFTVFAPVNSAFSKLPEGAVEALLKPIADRNRRSQEEQNGITNLFVSLLDVDPSRSEMARSLIFHIPLPNSLGTPHPLER